MRPFTIAIWLLLAATSVSAQSYKDGINQYRHEYKMAFITDPESPLKPADTAFLRFFPVDHSWCVIADFKASPGSKPFQMHTHSGKLKTYREYGILSFKLHGKPFVLHVYQGLDLIAKDPQLADYLFIPFTDLTNYAQTFGGGRYIDLSAKDIKNNKIVLDFNKCYNPLCAFADGFSCPIPPKENSLSLAIRAGEKLFGKKVE